VDRQQIAVKLAVEGLNLSFKIGSFEDRLILQKVVYLAQAAGVNLGYYHQWYLHGPYCPSLTRDAYAIDEECRKGLDDSKNWKLDDSSSNRLQSLRKIIPQKEQNRRRGVELLASVHFLIDRKQVTGRDASPIEEILKRYKKDFSREEIEEALKQLVQNGLLPNQ